MSRTLLYGKIGRSWNLNPVKWSEVGGDADVWRLLHRLATQHPNDRFILIGRNTGEKPADVGMPSNVINPWVDLRSEIAPLVKRTAGDKWALAAQLTELVGAAVPELDDADGFIMWAGQHGTSNAPIPEIGRNWGEKLTDPQISSVNYCSYLLWLINRWRRHDPHARGEVWLCPDPRNYMKCRDLKWPLVKPVLAQFDMTRPFKHERYGNVRGAEEWGAVSEQSVWVSRAEYVYSGLELTAVVDYETAWSIHERWHHSDRRPFGMLVNENRRDGRDARLPILRWWVLPNWPDCEIFGSWTVASAQALGRERIDTVPVEQVYTTLGRWKSTLTTPASSSGWATAKPWECFVTGTICFFHPAYDTQNHILGDDPELLSFLRVEDPDELAKRVRLIDDDAGTYEYYRQLQFNRYQRAAGEARIERMIGEQL